MSQEATVQDRTYTLSIDLNVLEHLGIKKKGTDLFIEPAAQDC
ncbi:hypothetical protein F469_02282 [Pseudomonas sp. URMO17WK12:I2]|nr:hypothetical protein F469_02282 [Pseudomonas sp. URMO17WK12:I2]